VLQRRIWPKPMLRPALSCPRNRPKRAVSQVGLPITACGQNPAKAITGINRKLTAQGDRLMSTFDDREHAFEAKFAHDEEMKFKLEARRNKLVGLWAAEILGKTGDEAEAYAKGVIRADFEEAGHEDVIGKLKADLGDKVSEDELRAKFDALLIEAKTQLVNEN
jgi:hypothetical protein